MLLCELVLMRTTLDLPDPLFREMKARAARQGVKMRELVATFIENGLRGGNPVVPSTRSPLPIARRATGKTIRALDNARIAKILDAEDA